MPLQHPYGGHCVLAEGTTNASNNTNASAQLTILIDASMPA